MQYVYITSEPGLYTVGFYNGDEFVTDSDHTDRDAARKQVNYLNGGAEGDPRKGQISDS